MTHGTANELPFSLKKVLAVPMKQIGTVLARMLTGLAVSVMCAWAVLAIYYSNMPWHPLRIVAAVTFGLATLGGLCFLPRRGRAAAWFLTVFCAIVAWWLAIAPSNGRDWQRDVALLPYATVAGDKVTIRNVRNFSYRTETDFDAHYYDRTYDLEQLNSVDLIAVYWMGDAIAHVMMSFGFENGDVVCFSIETRKEKGEAYSSIKGFFKQYELIYIAGDERDLIRLRTDYRRPQEDVYLYRLGISPERARKFFMEYVAQINAMKDEPAWYNTLTTNCTTNIFWHARAFENSIRFSWKILLSGYTPQYAYELGVLDRSLPFGELQKRSYINDKAHRVGTDPGFSLKIREGLPRPAPATSR